MPTYSNNTVVFNPAGLGPDIIPVPLPNNAPINTGVSTTAIGLTFIIGSGLQPITGAVSLTPPDINGSVVATGASTTAYGTTFLLLGSADPPVPEVPPAPISPNPRFRYPVDIRCPNCYDDIVRMEADWWKKAQIHPPKRIPVYRCLREDEEPYRELPQLGQEFMVQRFIETPAPSDATTVILNYVPPPGYTAILWGYAHGILDSGGYESSSNQVFWRIFATNRYVPGFNAMNSPMGDISQPMPLPSDWIYIGNGNNRVGLRYEVNLPVGSPVTGGQVWAAVWGWEIPGNYWR